MSYSIAERTADDCKSLFKYIVHFRDKATDHKPQATYFSNDTPRERANYLRGAGREAREACMAIARSLRQFDAVDQFLTLTQPEYRAQYKALVFHVQDKYYTNIEHFDNTYGAAMLDAVLRKSLPIDQITYEQVAQTHPNYALFGRKPAANIIKLSGYGLITKFWATKPDFLTGKILKIDLFDNLNYGINNRIDTFVSPAIQTVAQVQDQAQRYAQQPQHISSFNLKH